MEEVGPVKYVCGYLRRTGRRPPKFRAMSDQAKELWYQRIDQIRQGRQQRDVYRHHPLVETAAFLPKFK